MSSTLFLFTAFYYIQSFHAHLFLYFPLFSIKDKFKVQRRLPLSSFIKMVCALFCAKGPYFFRQNIQFTAYNNDVKFAHNLFCSLDISQKYILYPSFTMCNQFHALLLQFIDAIESVSANLTVKHHNPFFTLNLS